MEDEPYRCKVCTTVMNYVWDQDYWYCPGCGEEFVE